MPAGLFKRLGPAGTADLGPVPVRRIRSLYFGVAVILGLWAFVNVSSAFFFPATFSILSLATAYTIILPIVGLVCAVDLARGKRGNLVGITFLAIIVLTGSRLMLAIKSWPLLGIVGVFVICGSLYAIWYDRRRVFDLKVVKAGATSALPYLIARLEAYRVTRFLLDACSELRLRFMGLGTVWKAAIVLVIGFVGLFCASPLWRPPPDAFHYPPDVSAKVVKKYLGVLDSWEAGCRILVKRNPPETCTYFKYKGAWWSIDYYAPIPGDPYQVDYSSLDPVYYNWLQPADAVLLAKAYLAALKSLGFYQNAGTNYEIDHPVIDKNSPHPISDAELIAENGLPANKAIYDAAHDKKFLPSTRQFGQSYQPPRYSPGMSIGQTATLSIIVFFCVFMTPFILDDWFRHRRLKATRTGYPRLVRYGNPRGGWDEVIEGDLRLLRRKGVIPGLASSEGPLRVQYVHNVRTGGYDKELVGDPDYVPPVGGLGPAFSRHIQAFDERLNCYVWTQIIEGDPNLPPEPAPETTSDMHGSSRKMTDDDLEAMRPNGYVPPSPPLPVSSRSPDNIAARQTSDDLHGRSRRGQDDDLEAMKPSPAPHAETPTPAQKGRWRAAAPGEVFQPGRRFQFGSGKANAEVWEPGDGAEGEPA